MTAAKAKLPAGVDKLPEGVELIGSSVRIHFMYRGERCREKIPGANVSKALIRYAGNKRLLIVTDPARMANGRMILFNCWAGLSLSEIIALGVDDVDREAGGVWVRR
ncbi:Arm DNA-binding domain-containing protein, partial [Pseudomonas nitroreducens]